nr:uncharacterized protein LOC128702923 [Cherax quadricarinatus]
MQSHQQGNLHMPAPQQNQQRPRFMRPRMPTGQQQSGPRPLNQNRFRRGLGPLDRSHQEQQMNRPRDNTGYQMRLPPPTFSEPPRVTQILCIHKSLIGINNLINSINQDTTFIKVHHRICHLTSMGPHCSVTLPQLINHHSSTITTSTTTTTHT